MDEPTQSERPELRTPPDGATLAPGEKAAGTSSRQGDLGERPDTLPKLEAAHVSGVNRARRGTMAETLLDVLEGNERLAQLSGSFYERLASPLAPLHAAPHSAQLDAAPGGSFAEAYLKALNAPILSPAAFLSDDVLSATREVLSRHRDLLGSLGSGLVTEGLPSGFSLPQGIAEDLRGVLTGRTLAGALDQLGGMTGRLDALSSALAEAVPAASGTVDEVRVQESSPPTSALGEAETDVLLWLTAEVWRQLQVVGAKIESSALAEKVLVSVLASLISGAIFYSVLTLPNERAASRFREEVHRDHRAFQKQLDQIAGEQQENRRVPSGCQLMLVPEDTALAEDSTAAGSGPIKDLD